MTSTVVSSVCCYFGLLCVYSPFFVIWLDCRRFLFLYREFFSSVSVSVLRSDVAFTVSSDVPLRAFLSRGDASRWTQV